MAGPMQRAAATDTTTEAPKNAWSQAKAVGPSSCPMVPRDGEGRHLQRQPPHVRRHHSRGAAVGREDWSRLARRRQRERSTPPKLSNHRHGYGEHLRAEHLRAREEKEEPWSDGSDQQLLWRGQKEEEQGERLLLKGQFRDFHSCASGLIVLQHYVISFFNFQWCGMYL